MDATVPKPIAATGTRRTLCVVIVLFPGFQSLDVAAIQDAFAEVSILTDGQCRYELITAGTTRGNLQSSSGLTVLPDRTIFDAFPELDTIVVPGGAGMFDVFDDAVLRDWLQRHATRSRRLCAVCNGVFALGPAGFLDGKRVTTHWMHVERLSSCFPGTKIEPDSIYTKDRGIYTTAGVTAAIDLALALIEEDFGRRTALSVAKFLIVYLGRAGGQSQFSPLLGSLSLESSSISSVQQHILKRLDAHHTLASLAQHAAMSPRHLSRLFNRECGLSPIAFLGNARIDQARQYLEVTDLSLKDIARRCGFENAAALRRAFRKRLAILPLEYRYRFRSPAKRTAGETVCLPDQSTKAGEDS
jgi:transcriptional regulator GlxA family with amidase domain